MYQYASGQWPESFITSFSMMFRSSDFLLMISSKKKSDRSQPVIRAGLLLFIRRKIIMMDETFSYILAIAALVIGVMLLTGHGAVFMKGGNTQARSRKYDEKKMEKVSGICMLLIGIATGIDAFTTSVTAKIVYVVVLFVILAVFCVFA